MDLAGECGYKDAVQEAEKTVHMRAFGSLTLLIALLVSACSSGAPPTGPSSARGPTAAQSNAAQTNAGQPNAAPTTSSPSNTNATSATGATGGTQQASGQPEQRSAQAGGDPGGPASDAPAAPIVARSKTTGRPITIEVWLTDWEQTTQQLFNDQLVPAFEAANPDVAVNVQYLDWRVFTEKLIAAHAGGVLPDVYQAGAEYVAPLATKGMAMDIGNYVDSWAQKDDFYESAWNTVTYQGKTYGVPVLSAPQTLMYRKDMLSAAGISSAPATWDDLEQVAAKATTRDGDKFTVSGFNARPIWQQYMWFLFQNGGDVFTADGQVVVNSPQAVEALDFFSKLFNQDKVASKSTIAAPTANVGAMAANLVAMQLGNQLTVRDFRDNNPSQAGNLVVADPITRKQQVTTNWTDWLAISQQSKHADAAWKFVSFVADRDNLLKYNETMYFIPPRKSLRTQGYMADPQLQQFVTIMEKYGRTINTNPAALEVYQTIMQNAVDDAVYQKKSSQQALDDAAKNIQRAMRR
ncbi:MAG: extracellular solute-binding protein [Chloroflexi bacterium]|nr:extracellular solute-binding protein [Chloroflexota bacterium]